MAQKRDYYEVLGINKNASKDDIKSAYRKLVRKYHPDNKETGDEAKFKEVQEAYDILYDDQKRQTYDQFGHAAFEQGAGGPGAGNPFEGGGFGFDMGDLGDIFSNFFAGGSRRRNSNGPTRGQDALYRIQIDFMDAVKGRDVDITLNIDDTCPSCNGSGAKSPSDISTCQTCKGSGYVRIKQRSLFGVIENQQTCSACGGSGKTIQNKCPNCMGKGYVKKKKTFTLHIHPGISSGQQLRIEGMGERGLNGGPNGDLYVEVIVKNHQFFKRDGNDIHIEIPLDFEDAILGCKIDIPTVNGESTLEIPSGTQPNQVLRMKGEGVKDYRSGRPGDQYVHLDIQMPKYLNKDQKKAIEDYKKAKGNESLFDKFKKKFKK